MDNLVVLRSCERNNLRIKENKFIRGLLDLIGESPKIFSGLLIRESMQWKDLRLQGIDPKQIYKGFNNLKRRKILVQDGEYYRFTDQGLKWFKRSTLNYFKFRNKKWDKKWRVVIFDIPKELHKNRTVFQKKIKDLGFFQLQKSVYIYPYPCEEDLGYVAEALGVNDYVDVITADSIGFREDEIKKYFFK